MIEPTTWKRAAPALALVTQLSSGTIAGFLVGGWLDHKLGTRPWIAMVLGIGGFGVGLRHLFFFLKHQPPDAPPDPPAP